MNLKLDIFMLLMLLGAVNSQGREVIKPEDNQVLNDYDNEELPLDNGKECAPDSLPFQDKCDRHCRCVAGKVQCCRLRREFTHMTHYDRTRYINTVITASTDPAYKSRYEELLTLHHKLFNILIHNMAFFLPWHRWYILQYENLLREIDCGVTVPYWDWSLDAAKPFYSNIWSPYDGFGGNGRGYLRCVVTGPFNKYKWSLIQSAGEGCLERNFNGRVIDAIDVRELILLNKEPSHFENFTDTLENFHDIVHCAISGTMCTNNAASAPEFFLHHGFIDKIWLDWQNLGVYNKFNLYFLTQTILMPATKYQSRALLDLQNLPGGVCADYVEPPIPILKDIKGLSLSQLKDIPRLPLPKISNEAIKLFRLTREDIQRTEKLLATFSRVRPLRKNQLRGRADKLFGFKTSDVENARDANKRQLSVESKAEAKKPK